MKRISIAVFLLALAACGGGGVGNIDLSGISFHFPFAVPGGPYDGLAGEPVQFDGSGSSDDEGHALTYEWDFGDGGTSTLVMPTHTYSVAGTYAVTLRVCDPSDCSINDGSTSAVIASLTNASPGGIWFGTDSEGDNIVALITETGRFHFLDEFDFQGSGIVAVSATDEFDVSFRFVPPVGGSFADGTAFADCSASGLLTERSTLDGTVACTTAGGTQSSVAVSLTYQALYDLDSDLAAFVGTWTDSSNPGVDVVNVDAMGVITGQDGSGSGCIYDGQVTIIDPNYNAYDIEWTYLSCVGQSAVLNGVTFSGIGAIDNTVTPTEFVLGATGIVQSTNEISLVLFYEQI
jgi:PKD repeat protein